MKTIGLIGGMSWESTVTYYQVINRVVKEKLGGFCSAKCLLYSVNFDEIEKCQMSGDWKKSGEILNQAALSLKKGGADFIVLCTNTMHKVADQIMQNVDLPFLHIAEATASRLKAHGICKTALFGTKFTMQQDFYKSVLIKNGIDVIIPNDDDVSLINDVIYNQLCMGEIKQESKKEFLRIIYDMQKQGAESVILGCTEIGLLVQQQDTSVKLFDTALIHAEQAALFAIE